MSNRAIKEPEEYLHGNPYPGRCIILGMDPSGTKLMACYFIMGRSDNSRNRVFVSKGQDLMIKPFDEAKVEDPSLIIYYPVRALYRGLIVTNGDQTDTIYDHIKNGSSFQEALRTREFEPDEPNFTPRISGMASFEGKPSYSLSILKSADDKGSACSRFFYEYEGRPGTGHLIHTYITEGEPLPSFEGEPVEVTMTGDVKELAKRVWDSLDEDNRISLYARAVDIATDEYEEVIINKHQ